MRLTVTGWRGAACELGSPDSASFSDGGDALQAALAIIDDWRGGTLKGCEVNVGELSAGDSVGSVTASAPASSASRTPLTIGSPLRPKRFGSVRPMWLRQCRRPTSPWRLWAKN